MADSNIKKGKIGNALESVAPDHVVAVANDIYDETLGKYQSELNQQIGQGGYTPPQGGIPKKDLASDVQASLVKANSSVQQVKVGNNAAINPSNGVITLPNYTENATPHIAPTAAEVKTALGTGTNNDTFLRKDGSWASIPSDSSKANATDLNNEIRRAQVAESELRTLYNNLQQSQPIPVTQLPATGEAGKIYRLAGNTSYTDYMWNGTEFIQMATYDNAIDEVPIKGSANLVKSGGVFTVKEIALTNKANMSEISDPLPKSSITDNAFLYNGSVRSHSDYEIWWYDIQDDSVYLFSGAKTSTQYGFDYICWFDGNDNFLGTSFPMLEGDETVLKDEITVPLNGARKAGVSVRKILKSYHDLKKSTDAILSRELEEAIDIIADKKRLAKVSEESGIIVDGVHRDNQYYKTTSYNVIGGKTYYLTGEDYNTASGYYKVSWFDSDGSYINGDLYLNQTSSNKVFIQTPIKAPDNASKLSVCSSNALLVFSRIDELVSKKGYTISTKNYLPSCDLSDVIDDGVWMLIDSYSYTDKPVDVNAGFLKVFTFSGWILQEFFDFHDAKVYLRHFRQDKTSMSSWGTISGGANNEYVFNNYAQTVNLTATPTIGTDTNNYLASTNNNTDRTADILAMLQSTGVCNLGPGLFVVNNLVMPDNTTLVGSGEKTWLRLIDGNDKFAVKMGKLCQIHNMRIQGAASAITPSSTVGTRHGIVWTGNYTQTKDWSQNPYYGKLSNLTIERFSGGGITFSDTGYNVRNNMEVINCHIFNCGAGLNISYWSEYHKFTNVQCLFNYYGCINNGGNNTFVNCDFSSNLGIGFLMDNSQNQSPNNSHGSCVCCVFNHTADNTGVGIKILNCNNGFVFSGGQIFFSKIQIEDSAGIEVVSTNFGQSNCDIIIKNGGVILFANNLHQDTPPSISITNNNKVHFVNCYNRANGNIISA